MLTEGVMLVDLFKGTVFCAALGLSTLGGLTVVPDRYWDSFPSALAPAREALAEIGVAPLKFRAGASSVTQPVQKETREPVPAPDQLALEQQTRVQIGAPRRGIGYNPELDRSSLDAESLPAPGGDRNSDSDPIRSTSATSPKFVGTSTEPGADELPNRAPVSIADIPDPPADPLQDQEFFLDEPPLESRESLDSLLASPDSIDSEPLIVEEEKALDPDETKYSTPSRLAAFKTPEKSSVNADANTVAPLAATAATSAAVKAQTANPVAAPVANQSAPLATTSANQPAPLATTSANQSAPLATTSAFASSSPAPSSSAVTPPAVVDQTPYSGPQNLQASASQELQDPLAQNWRGQDSQQLPDSQGYLDSGSNLAADDSPYAQSHAENNVQSFDDYLKSQASQPTVNNPQLIQETVAVQNVPINTASNQLPTLDSLEQSLRSRRSPDETRTLFLAANDFRRAQGSALAPNDLKRLNAILDSTGFEVFYDPEKAILEQHLITRQGDTFASIAQEYQVNPEMLASINNIAVASDAPLTPGTQLKVVRGPASAEISISRRELTLFFNGLYAGRFTCGVPQAYSTLRGQYVVGSKIPNPECDAVDMNGVKTTIPGGDRNNPLGACWISLRNGPGLHGTNRPDFVGTFVTEGSGFIFSNVQIGQLAMLLTQGSVVTFVD